MGNPVADVIHTGGNSYRPEGWGLNVSPGSGNYNTISLIFNLLHFFKH